jgi:hypothetical protein
MYVRDERCCIQRQQQRMIRKVEFTGNSPKDDNFAVELDMTVLRGVMHKINRRVPKIDPWRTLCRELETQKAWCFQRWHTGTNKQVGSRTSAAELSTVLRTTTLSYGNMRFSGTCPAETPQPTKMKFCTINYVGEITRFAKNDWNQLAGGGPTDRWNEILKTSLTLHYLTLPSFSCMPPQQKRLNRFACTMAQTTWFAVRKCLLGVALIRIYISESKPQKPQISEPGCQISSQINTHE